MIYINLSADKRGEGKSKIAFELFMLLPNSILLAHGTPNKVFHDARFFGLSGEKIENLFPVSQRDPFLLSEEVISEMLRGRPLPKYVIVDMDLRVTSKSKTLTEREGYEPIQEF